MWIKKTIDLAFKISKKNRLLSDEEADALNKKSAKMAAS
jgi:type I restriction enzyme R subunit